MCFWVSDSGSCVSGSAVEVNEQRLGEFKQSDSCILLPPNPGALRFPFSHLYFPAVLSFLLKILTNQDRNHLSLNNTTSRAGIKLENGFITGTSGSGRGAILTIFKKYKI